MAENLNISRFRNEPTGITTIIRDQTQSVNLPDITGRLIVGSSRKGMSVINSPVYVDDARKKNRIYGSNDKFLENRGSFFHRTIDVSLNEGPVYTINILPVSLQNDDGEDLNPDRANFVSLNTESSANNDLDLYRGGGRSEPFKDFFDRKKFWFASEEKLNTTKNNSLGENRLLNPEIFGTLPEANKILSFANLGQDPVTVFTRKANTSSYSVTAQEYYNQLQQDLPQFVHPDDIISDYFIEVIMVKGNWTNYRSLSEDPVYSQYFNKMGIIESEINNFLILRDVEEVGRATGCLIPDFLDTQGNDVSLDTVVNGMLPLTDVMVSMDTRKLENMDLDTNSYDETDISTYRVDATVGYGYEELSHYIDDGDYQVDATKLIDTLSYRKPGGKVLVYEIDDTQSVDSITIETSGSNEYIRAYEDSNLFRAWREGYIATGTLNISDSVNSTQTQYIRIEGVEEDNTGSYINIYSYSDQSRTNLADILTYGQTSPGNDYVAFELDQGNFKHEFNLSMFDDFEYTEPNKLRLNITNITSDEKDLLDEFVKKNHYLKAKLIPEEGSNTISSRNRFLKIISVAETTDSASPQNTYMTITTMNPTTDEIEGIDIDSGNKFTAYKGISNFITNLKGFYLKNFKIRNELLPDGSSQKQEAIHKFLWDTNIAETIVNGEVINVRYLIDSYKGSFGGADNNQSKYYLARLCAAHQKMLGILNDPSMEQFEESTDPAFIDLQTQTLDTSYIADGGNLALNPSATFELVSGELDGNPIGSYVGYFMPNVLVRENSKNISVPPAAYVGNAYMRKLRRGNQYRPVMATYGRITEGEVIGLEYDFTDADRKNLEQAGHNMIVSRRGLGRMIYSDNTAYQQIQSALNNLSNRDTLITLERDIERILFNFLGSFNDETTRLRISSIVDNYLDDVVAARGIVRKQVTMNQSNNDGEVLKENLGVIDISVEFSHGIKHFVNRITLLPPEGADSGSSFQMTGFA